MSGRTLPGRLTPLLVVIAITALSACGDAQQPAISESVKPATSPVVDSPEKVTVTPRAGLDLNGRTEVLMNPDDTSIVFLYQDLSSLTPPIEQWVEVDNRVRSSDPRDRAAMRQTIKSELEAAASSVGDVGQIRLSLQNANLSHYDSTYGEFIVGALSPGSVIEYNAFGRKVNLKFANGRTAQIWKVTPEQGQEIDDRLTNFQNVRLDVLMQIKSVMPGRGGGSIMVDVVEYELRDGRDDTTIGRIKIPQ